MVIEIRTRPNINGNCKRLFLHSLESGYIETITEEYNRIPHHGFQVTPAEFKRYAELKRRKEERAAAAAV